LITTAELHRIAEQEGLRFDQVERDYVIVWLLSSLAELLGGSKKWVFKGGTCLRHCYYPGYRFSEDIDFSCRPGGDNAAESRDVLETATGTIEGRIGLDFVVRHGHQSPGQEQLEIPVQYSRGGARRSGLPAVKIHLTFDEPVLVQPELCRVKPAYADLPPFDIYAYSKLEIVAEKMRSLLQQQDKWPRPRDLYDLWFMLCHRSETLPRNELKLLFASKCEARGITPDRSSLIGEDLRARNREAWRVHIVPMMKSPPEYEQVWSDWVRTCSDLL
jgi:predicted nucleotidyltransferase component of viral defense system